jgi:hypothetical protein
MRRRERDIKVKQICKSKKRSEHWEKVQRRWKEEAERSAEEERRERERAIVWVQS